MILNFEFNKALGLDKISGKLLKDTAIVVALFLNLCSTHLWPKKYFLVIGRTQGCHPYINQEIEMSAAITDQYLFCPQYLRFSKRLFSIT